MNDRSLLLATSARALRLAAPLGLLLLGSALGCISLKAYPGQSVPRTERARIEPAWMGGTEINIESVDGIGLSWLQDRADVLPGHHTLTASLVLRSGLVKRVQQFDVVFDAEAGQHYLVLGEQSVHGPRMWIADADMHTVAEVDFGMLPEVSARSGSRAPAER